nr:unnamed protein product [Callosobruchus chinensis]
MVYLEWSTGNQLASMEAVLEEVDTVLAPKLLILSSPRRYRGLGRSWGPCALFKGYIRLLVHIALLPSQSVTEVETFFEVDHVTARIRL